MEDQLKNTETGGDQKQSNTTTAKIIEGKHAEKIDRLLKELEEIRQRLEVRVRRKAFMCEEPNRPYCVCIYLIHTHIHAYTKNSGSCIYKNNLVNA